MTVSASVSGEKELKRKLERIRKGLRTATRQAVNRALTIVKRSVVAETPRGPTGNLKRSIGKRLLTSTGRPEVDGLVGPNVARRARRGVRTSNTAPHAHLVVWGSKPRYTKTGAYRGVMPQNPFVDRGYISAMSAAEAAIVSSFGEKVEALANK